MPIAPTYAVRETATNLRRNVLMTLAAIVTMTIAMIMTTAISLGFFGAGLLVANQIGEMKELYYDKLEVSIYLKDDINAGQREAVTAQLDSSPEVAAGLRRNLTMTIAMIMTTAISLAFFGAGLLVANQIGDMKELYFDKLEVSIYLKDNATPVQREAITSQLNASPEIASFDYLDKKAAYERFKKLFKGNPQLISQATEDDLPATYLVRMKDPERYTILAQQFPNGKNGVDQVQGQSEVLDRIFSLFNGVRNAAIALALLQALAALLLISNTIQVAAFNRRVETGIMRLVGASRWYTQLPFVLEAALAGLAGAVLAVLGLIAAKFLFVDKTLAEPIRSGIVPPIDLGSILAISPYVAGVGVILASVAAYVTLRLYVRL